MAFAGRLPSSGADKSALTRSAIAERAYEVFHRAIFDYSRELASTQIAELQLLDGRVLAKTRHSNLVFELFPEDERQAPLEALNFGDCEAFEIGQMQSFVNPSSCVLDIGANIGWHCLHLAQGAGCVHAFEPVPATFMRLAANVSLNGVQNVSAHNLGFTNEGTHRAPINYDARRTGAASLAPRQSGGHQLFVNLLLSIHGSRVVPACPIY